MSVRLLFTSDRDRIPQKLYILNLALAKVKLKPTVFRLLNALVKLKQLKVYLRIIKNIPLGYTWATRQIQILSILIYFYGISFL